MLDIGWNLCHRCVSAFRDAVYFSSAKAMGVTLRHSQGVGKLNWAIEPFSPSGNPLDPDEELTLKEVKDGEDGLPSSVTVHFKSTGRNYQMTRCCPYCKENEKFIKTELPNDSGKYQTFVIVLAGSSGVGKTAWLETVSTQQVLAKLNNEAAYPYALEFVHSTSQLDPVSGATNKGQIGQTNFLRIRKKETGEIAAFVVVRDAPGEEFKTINKENDHLQRVLRGGGDYSGADAVIYFEEATARASKQRNLDIWNKLQEMHKAYDNINITGALDGKPVAYVATHMDRLLKNKAALPKVKDAAGKTDVLILSEKTFPVVTGYKPKDVLDRFAMEDLICRGMEPDMLVNYNENRRGFLVQSCGDIVQLEEHKINPRDENRNVLDPLIWVLNRLQIFPIPRNPI